MKIADYHTDLTDDQWVLLKPLLPKAASTGRPRTPLRSVVDAILYVVKSGCQWRLLPSDFPRWKTVYGHFRRWYLNGVLEAIHRALRTMTRKAAGKRPQPTAGSIDSQTVRSDAHGGPVGYDAAKMTKGRKRFLCVDTMGLILDAVVAPANTPEREGAKRLLEPVLERHRWIRKLWADGGFSGEELRWWIKGRRPNAELDIIGRPANQGGFSVLPKRWVIERTFGWLHRHRRLVRDYEKTPQSARAWIFTAMIRLMLRRLA